jgi:hypothetical protein
MGMETFEYEVKLKVQVKAFNESDGLDSVMDAFAVGENCGTTIVDCEYSDGKKTSK